MKKKKKIFFFFYKLIRLKFFFFPFKKIKNFSLSKLFYLSLEIKKKIWNTG
jgi:hypothetical protein